MNIWESLPCPYATNIYTQDTARDRMGALRKMQWIKI